MGRAEKEFGARVELQCRDLCRRVWPGAYRVGQQMPVREPDIARTPYWIECKGSVARSGLRPWAALDQALRDKASTLDDRPPLIYLKAKRQPAMVMMLADDWIELERELRNLREEVESYIASEPDPLKGGGIW